MVATVLRLRLSTTRRQLQREWWRALLFAAGGVWALSLFPAVLWFQRYLSLEAADVRAPILVGLAAVCVAGWIVVPLLVTGLDDTLDPGRFAGFGVSARRIVPGLAVAAFLTVPALFFCVMFVVLALSWQYQDAPVLAVALVGAVLTAAVVILGARVAVGWAARAVTDRQLRRLGLMGIVGGLAVLASAGWIVMRDGLESALSYELPVVLEWLGRTPVGAGMHAPLALVYGDVWGAAWRLAMMVGTVAVLVLAWHASVAHALVHPVHRGGGRRRRTDAILEGVEREERSATWRPAWLRADVATAAVRARALVYWATDARYLVGAAGVVALPIFFVAVVIPVLGLDERWVFASPVMLAASIGWGRHNDVAYDSTAMWLDLVSGNRGRAVMAGRTQAVVVWAAPAVGVAALGVLAWSGEWGYAPGLIGACVGALGVTLGVGALASVLLPYRAPAPGENPFGAEVGSMGASIIAQLVSSTVTLAMLPFVTVPLVLALVVHTAWGVVALVTGVVLGVGGAVLGVRLAGTAYDRRAGKLLGAVS